MTTVNLSSLAGAGWQFFDNNGVPLSGGLLYTYLAGTTTQVATYTSANGSVANSNPIVLDASGRTTNEIWLTGGTTYKFVLQTSSAVQIWSNDNISGINDLSSLYAVSGASLVGFKQGNSSSYYTGASNRTIASKLQESVSVLDFGADPTGTNDCTAAIQSATNTGQPVFFPAGTYKIVTGGISYTGTVVWFGEGSESIINCDSTVLTVYSGNNSIIDNLYMQNITAPWIILRNPSNWTAAVTPVQSNGNGYQPTANDTDIWSSLTTAQQTQNIGPSIVFQNNAQNITVSRIYGRFVTITMYDAIQSVVRDCNFRAGKGIAGIAFWNQFNQFGNQNQAINNLITYPSFCGITYFRNSDGLVEGNQVLYAGESGVKTYQDILSGVQAYCYRMQVIGNYVLDSYYDGFDLQAQQTLGTSIDTRHNIVGNSTFGNYRTGFIADGSNTQFVGNYARGCYLTGMDLYYSNSAIQSNAIWDCNLSNSASGQHQMIVAGPGNSIVGNYINQSVSNGDAIYATSTNYVATNKAVGGAIFLGSPNAVTATSFGNEDNGLGIQGTFTPTILVGSTVQSTSSAIGNYTKVGFRVYFDISIQINASISGTGNVSISLGSLPSAIVESNYAAVINLSGSNFTFTGAPCGIIVSNSNSIILGSDASGGSFTQFTNSNLSSTSGFTLSGSYVANI